MAFHKNFHLITETDILNLVSNKVPESKTLEYKQVLKFSGADDKKEFLADVSSFANSEGGLIIYGVSEQKNNKGENTGNPEEITGIEIENPDKLILSIEQILQASIEPNISNTVIKSFKISDKNVLIIGVPRQWSLPKMVTFNNTNKFYRRRNTGKYLPDVYELNQMFMNNSELAKEALQFKEQRLSDVRNLKFIPNLNNKNSTFIHIIPLSFQRNSISLNDYARIDNIKKVLKPIDSNGYDGIYNFEGYLLFYKNVVQIDSYSQLFRNGIIESYTDTFHRESEGIKNFELSYFETTILKFVKKAFETYQLIDIYPPFLIYLSLFDLEKRYVDYRLRPMMKPFSKTELHLSPIIINDFNASLDTEFRNAFDVIWQSAGVAGSPNYDANGNLEKLKY